MTAVGATNVGSVKVGMDPDLVTNVRKWESDTFHQKVWEVRIDISVQLMVVLNVFSGRV